MEEWLLLLKNEYLIEFITLLCLIFVAIIGFYISRKIILPLIFIQNYPYLCLFCHYRDFKQLSGRLCRHLQHPADVLQMAPKRMGPAAENVCHHLRGNFYYCPDPG